MKETDKSLDEQINLIAALLRDVQTLHSNVFSPTELRLLIKKIEKRCSEEGSGFLTKALPRLAKALDKALALEDTMDAAVLGFKPIEGSKLPLFLGSLFRCVFSDDGQVLPTPCVASIKSLRQVLYLFYKYELPYDQETEKAVIDSFIKTEDEVASHSGLLSRIAKAIESDPEMFYWKTQPEHKRVIKKARRLLFELFKHFDVRKIQPRHGPGAVSTREQFEGKFRWTKISPRLVESYPLDEYFYASLGHVCDRIQEIQNLEFAESNARVVLVPKDSRGPRLISCEPLDFQWIQQGLSRAIVRHVEHHSLTMFNVHFTDQGPNQRGALLGSSTGRYATLDLKEASDRVSLGLVTLLFPEPLLTALMNCRSLATELPGGKILKLHKFAPMGSALCFPVMALTVWAILTAAAPDTDTRESVLVYGDDVVVPTAYAANAITWLELFGLKVNRDKSCVKGFFRESCGMDAYRGECVTPVRLRTVWTHHRSPDSYVSYIAYANAAYKRGYFRFYDLIVEDLVRLYGRIPEARQRLSCPSLIEVPESCRCDRTRTKPEVQQTQYYVWNVIPRKVTRVIDGWEMLLRYFAYAQNPTSPDLPIQPSQMRRNDPLLALLDQENHFSVDSYTKPRSCKLVKQWISPYGVSSECFVDPTERWWR